jgi:hypothetical protein
MYLQMFLQVSLLGKLHAAVLLLALEWLVLGVAPEMCEIFAEGRDYALAALEMACEDFELSF